MNTNQAMEKMREVIRRMHLAHSQLETTMGYLHAETLSVRSPSEIAPSAVPDDLLRAVELFEKATEFLESRYMERLIANTLTAAVLRAASPLCDRQGAAALALCSVDQIDAADKSGIIKRHLRGETPLYEKAEIVEAITQGRWRFKK